MTKCRSASRFRLLLPVLFLGFSLGAWAQDRSESAFTRLIEISTQLSSLNERLQIELQDSRQSSRELQSMLEVSKRELEELRRELVTLRISSAALSNKAENSQTESTALLSALRKAESSLMSLELSFTAYREASEKGIKSLERQNKLWKWGCAAAGVLAAGFGTALLAGR